MSPSRTTRRSWLLAALAIGLMWAYTADLSAQPLGQNPIFALARTGDAGGVEYLLKKGYDVEAAEADGGTVLILGAANGHVAVVEAALAVGARVDRQDSSGRTALSRAAEGGHYAAVERLVERKADINVQTREGLTPLMLAVKGRHLSGELDGRPGG